MEKKNKDILLVTYTDVLNWVKSKKPTENNPVYIHKCGVKSDLPFRIWHFADTLLLMGNEQDKNIHQYILTEEKWNQFCKYIKRYPEMNRGELSRFYRDYGCTDKTFWPSVILICIEYLKDNNIAYGTVQ